MGDDDQAIKICKEALDLAQNRTLPDDTKQNDDLEEFNNS